MGKFIFHVIALVLWTSAKWKVSYSKMGYDCERNRLDWAIKSVSGQNEIRKSSFQA